MSCKGMEAHRTLTVCRMVTYLVGPEVRGLEDRVGGEAGKLG